MRKILVILVLAGVVFSGCTDVKVNNTSQPEPGTYSLVPIPARAGLSDEIKYSTTSTINGAAGGKMTLTKTYLGVTGRQVTLNVVMTFPAGAFSGLKTITITADDQYAALTCTPSMVFAKTVLLDFSYKNLDIKNVYLPNNKNGFYYIADSGYLEPIASTSFLIDKNLGNLSVTAAQLKHFSRFGWTTLR